MVSKNNRMYRLQQQAKRRPHYGLRKLTVGVASVLLSTTFYMGMSDANAHAAQVSTNEQNISSSKIESADSSASQNKAKIDLRGVNLSPHQQSQPMRLIRTLTQLEQILRQLIQLPMRKRLVRHKQPSKLLMKISRR